MAQIIEMDDLTFAVLCTPFCVCATILNSFFIFCLCKPVMGVSIRQPLYFLLTAELGNSTIQQFIVMISVALAFLSPPKWLLVVSTVVIFQTYCSNFSTNAWISIFYYMKIVPQHWKVFVWIKKNIKAIVFAGFAFDQILLLSALTMGAASYLPPPGNHTVSNNLTGMMVIGPNVSNNILFKLGIKVFLVYFICPFCTLSFSWGRTFTYLRGHIKRMDQTTGCSSNPQQKHHMRVTAMGIVQTALFIPASLWAITMALLFSTLYETLDHDKHITMTISSISGLAKIVCLGFSQSVFRLRVIALLKRIKKAFELLDHVEQS